MLGDGVEVAGPLITILRSHDRLGIRDMPYSEIGFNLHVETGDALMQLRDAQGDLAGGGVVKVRGSERERLRTLIRQAAT